MTGHAHDVHAAHERRVVELTEVRVALDADIATRRRELVAREALRIRVQAEIDAEISTLVRAHQAARGLRCSLGDLVADLNPMSPGRAC